MIDKKGKEGWSLRTQLKIGHLVIFGPEGVVR